jgi:hypothetical protein
MTFSASGVRTAFKVFRKHRMSVQTAERQQKLLQQERSDWSSPARYPVHANQSHPQCGILDLIRRRLREILHQHQTYFNGFLPRLRHLRSAATRSLLENPRSDFIASINLSRWTGYSAQSAQMKFVQSMTAQLQACLFHIT